MMSSFFLLINDEYLSKTNSRIVCEQHPEHTRENIKDISMSCTCKSMVQCSYSPNMVSNILTWIVNIVFYLFVKHTNDEILKLFNSNYDI